MRVLLFPLALFSLLIVGCAGGTHATVSYDDTQNVTTYETANYTVSTRSGASLGSSKSVTMRAVSTCEGRDCSPDVVQLVFTADGPRELSLSGLDGHIAADQTRVQWSSAEAGINEAQIVDGNMLKVTGRFAVVDVSLQQFRQIATASSVEGSLGGLTLNINADVQAGMNALVNEATGKSSSENSTSASK